MSVITAGIMNILLLSIIVTVFIHRRDVEIRMFHYLHITLFCVCAMVFCWANALLFQVYMYLYIYIYL
jgi:hypothetical protein